MLDDVNDKPMFVPFRKPTSARSLTNQEHLFIRAAKSALIVFVVAVVLVSITTNYYEDKLRAVSHQPVCQAVVHDAGTSNANNR